MSEEKKICPIMSNNFLWGPREINQCSLPANEDGFVECQREKCALWVGLFAYEGKHNCGAEYGCAFAMLARKNESGSIPL